MKRAKRGNVTNYFDQFQLRFKEDSNSDAKSESGFNFFYSDSVHTNVGLLGALSPVPVVIPPFRSLLIVNTDPVNVRYVSLSDGHILPNTILAAPTVNSLAVVDGTVLGIITLASDVGFILGDHVTVSDDNSPFINGYVVGIVDLGGPGPYQFHIQTLPAAGADIDLSAYTVAANAHVYKVGTYGAVSDAVTGRATITTTTAHGYKVGDTIAVAGVTNAVFNGPWIINGVPSPTSFTFDLGAVNLVSGAGTTGIGLPFFATAGIPIAAKGGRLIISNGDSNTVVLASDAKVFGYLGQDTIIKLPDNI